MSFNVYPWDDAIWGRLASQMAEVPHGLLFYGRSGIGKLDLARRYAAALLCEAMQGAPCGSCQGCLWFAHGNHPDFRELAPAAMQEEGAGEAEREEAASSRKPSRQITVEQVRDLADFINLTTHRHGRRVVLIQPAEAMNANAQNALLKSLEEPPAGTVFILVTSQRHRILPTVRSRCRQVPVPVPEPEAAGRWLDQHGMSQPEVALAAAGYAPLDALRSGRPEALAERARFVGLLAARPADPLALAAAMQAEGLQKAAQVLAGGDAGPRARGARDDLRRQALATAVNWMQKWTYDLLAFRLTGEIRYHPDHADAVSAVARGLDARALGGLHRRFLEFGQVVQHPLNPELFAEQLAIEYARTIRGTEERNLVGDR